MGLADYEHVLVTDAAQWRDWLAANHATSPGIWLVVYKRSTGRPAPTYDEVVEEALCFGWIDSTVRTRDEDTGMQLLTPRKPKSTWSVSNKIRVERLIAEGRMRPPGLAAIELAKANGSWDYLTEVEKLTIPPDLAAALAATPGAAEFFASLPPSALKAHLWWVVSAKRPETRARRVAAIVAAASQGKRAV